MDYGNIASANTVCFNTIDYGCLGDFKNIDSQAYLYLPGEQKTVTITRRGTNDIADIYKRIITKKCNGLRGNICGGPYEIQLIYESTCPQTPVQMRCDSRSKNLNIEEICRYWFSY